MASLLEKRATELDDRLKMQKQKRRAELGLTVDPEELRRKRELDEWTARANKFLQEKAIPLNDPHSLPPEQRAELWNRIRSDSPAKQEALDLMRFSPSGADQNLVQELKRQGSPSIHANISPMFLDDSPEVRGMQETAERVFREGKPASAASSAQREMTMLGDILTSSPNAYIPRPIIDYLEQSGGEDLTQADVSPAGKARQAWQGTRVEALRKQIAGMPDSPEKIKLIQELGRADVNMSRMHRGLAPAVGLGIGALTTAGFQGLFELARYGGKAKLLRDHLSEEERKLPKDQQLKLLGERSPFAARLLLKGEETDKITPKDALTAAQLSALPAGGAYLMGKGTVADLVGAQRFWHGTDAESGAKILETGIDPGFGGREGGAAWRGTERQKLVNQLEELHPLITSKNPGHRALAIQELGGPEELADRLTRLGVAQDTKERLLESLSRRYQRSGVKALDEVQPGLRLSGKRQGHIGRAMGKLGPRAMSRAMAGDLTDLEAVDKEIEEWSRLSQSKKPDVPVDASGFQERASGRAYVATDRGAALNYGHMQDPSEGIEAMRDAERSARKANDRLNAEVAGPRATLTQQLIDEGMDEWVAEYEARKRIPIGSPTKGEMADTAKKMLKGVYRTNLEPEKPILIGGVMPAEEFGRRFEQDPDDVMQLGAAVRTKNPVQPGQLGTDELIDPKSLAKNDVSLAQILRARTRNPMGYITGKGLPADARLLGLNRQFLRGVGKAGVLGGLTGAAGYWGVRPIVKKFKSKPQEPQAPAPSEDRDGWTDITPPA